MSELPVVVIGAGPQGLASAAHLVERGADVIVMERGDGPAAAVTEWGHVRLFSSWPELTDAAARRLLEPTGWTAPGSGYPTGGEWVEAYLAPLAEALGEKVRYSTTVTGVARKGRDLTVDGGRKAQPYVVHTVDDKGNDARFLARAVIDASGTWALPNPAGADGLSAVGEKRASAQISYRIPAEVEASGGEHFVVIGSGHSATHTALRLSEVARRTPGVRITWLMRRGTVKQRFGVVADELPERAALGGRARKIIESGLVDVITDFRVAEFQQEGETLTITAENGTQVTDVSQVFVLTGFRPDTSIFSELRVNLDTSLQAVAGIAEEIDPNLHSCGSIGATGARELAQPEEGFFIVGAKSYGRAPTFLALTGFEQVRSVVAHLSGDVAGAQSNQLVLPDTGVCGGSGDLDEKDSGASGGCCGAPTLLQPQMRPVAVN